MIEKLLTCADHDFRTSDPRRMEAHFLTSHPGVSEAARGEAFEDEKAMAALRLTQEWVGASDAAIDAGVSEKGAARQPSKIDWRDVMKRYLDIVLEAEGVRFLHKDDWSNEEWTAIQTLSEES